MASMSNLPENLQSLSPTKIKHENSSEDTLDLKSTWSHRAWVACGITTVFISLAKSVAGATTPLIWLGIILSGLTGYWLADPVSGIYHWALDNYGNGKTLVFGSQIQAFQGHHKQPAREAGRQFANNLHLPASVITFVVLPIILICHDRPLLLAFIGMFSACIIFSMQFHSWAHRNKNALHPIVVALQDAGIIISRIQHAAHHEPPYNNYYCVVSGSWNNFLAKHKVFETLERVLFFMFGLKPRSWAQP